jgi:crossover junction endodeoxyribonuclease RuvC
MRVLAIDPGLRITGYACLSCDDGSRERPSVIEAGCFRFDARRSVADRLVELDDDMGALIERTRPTHGAIERVFSHGDRPGPAIVMGHARGVILLRLRRAKLDLLELPPATVKKAVTGQGRATKEQVGWAIAGALGLAAVPLPLDIADAMAIGLAAIARLERPIEFVPA